MTDGLRGRVALVTGGSRGIGAAICRDLGAAGAAVAVHYHQRREAAAGVVAELSERSVTARAFAADLRSKADTSRLTAAVAGALGAPDILVNCAGVMTTGAVETMPDAQWAETLAVNLDAAFVLARACIPAMKRSGWGRIVNVASQAALRGSAQHAHYAAAKAGLLGLTYSLARELAAWQITVNAVSPGRIETDMLAAAGSGRMDVWMQQTPLGRLGSPDEVAAAVTFLASPRAGYITGTNLRVDGGLTMG